ncbi:MMPL family transporter [Streptosporangium amethystogenes]|uniref:MMPL family transporter n=1 Tax=Streptosporangium amethystogenes TaxID=2002 RepID=UPI00378F876A
MFESLGRAVYRGRWSLLVLGTAFAVLAGYFGLGLFGRMSDGGFEDPGAESTSAAEWSQKWFGGNSPDVVALYTHPTYEAADERFEKDVREALRALPAEQVASTTTYWSTKAGELVSEDRHSTYALITLRGGQLTKQSGYEKIRDELRSAPAGYTVKIGGRIPLLKDLNAQTGADLQQAEAISMPVLLVLLVMVFGSLVAAGLPLVVGLLSVAGALLLLRLLTEVTDVSVFSLNVVTMLGLGLAIDYSLFVLNAFREEIHRGASTEAAVVRTIATAGRTVAFSGLTVATSLSGLLLFPQMFLRSIGLGAAAVVLVAMVSAIVVLPALLAVLGPKVDAIKVMPDFGSRRGGTWHAIASSVMRRPVAYLLGVGLLLVALAAPFAHARFGSVDHRVLPEGFESRQVAEEINARFAKNALSPIEVIVLVERDLVGPMTASAPGALTSEVGTQRGPIGVGNSGITPVTPVGPLDVKVFAERLEALDHVTGVDVTGVSQNSGAVRLAVRYDRDPMSDEARALVDRIRELPPEPNFQDVVVGGPTAAQLDLQASLRATLPWTALVVCLMTGLLLFAAFGSILLPVKAILMNVVSLGASFGVIVWAFQDGHLASVLGFTPTGSIEATITVLILAVVFGLSMDYELFLLSRVRAEWLRTGDNTVAVAVGLERTGGVITSAALLLLVVIGAFSTAGITIVKMLGVGMFVAIVVDATLVRALLVPATMRLMGEANWWLPSFLRGFHRRIEIREHATDELPATYVMVERAGAPGAHRAAPARRLAHFPRPPQIAAGTSAQVPAGPPPPPPAEALPIAPAVPVRVIRTGRDGDWQWAEEFPPPPASPLDPHVPVPDVHAAEGESWDVPMDPHVPAPEVRAMGEGPWVVHLDPHVPAPEVRAAGEESWGSPVDPYVHAAEGAWGAPVDPHVPVPNAGAAREEIRGSRPDPAVPRNGSRTSSPEPGTARPWRSRISDASFRQNRSNPYPMPGLDAEPPPPLPARPTSRPAAASTAPPTSGPGPAGGRTRKVIKPNLDGPGWHWAEEQEKPSPPEPLLTVRDAMEQSPRHPVPAPPAAPSPAPVPEEVGRPEPGKGAEDARRVPSLPPVSSHLIDQLEPLVRPVARAIEPGPPVLRQAVPASPQAPPSAPSPPAVPQTPAPPSAPFPPAVPQILASAPPPPSTPASPAVPQTPTPPPTSTPAPAPSPLPVPPVQAPPVPRPPAGVQRRATVPASSPAAVPRGEAVSRGEGEPAGRAPARREAEEPVGGWVAVGTRTTRVVRPKADGSGWEWTEVDE